MKITLRKAIKVNDAITSIGNVGGLNIGVSYKLAMLKNSLEPAIKVYNKERDALYDSKKTDEDVSKLKENIDFLYVGIRGAYNVPILVKEFEAAEKELIELMDSTDEQKMVEPPDRMFKLADFEMEVSEPSEDGKKKIKKRVSLVNTSFLVAMADFITQEEEA